MSTVIRVENLGKKYILRHQANQEPYLALRDVMSDAVRNLGRRLIGRGAQIDSHPEKEEFWALQNLSFEVEQGDRVGIIGRNGAGKSTLLKILSRITEPSRGSVRISGRVASLLEVGTGFHPELTGRENIYLNGAILGMGRREIKRKFDEIVDFAEIERFLDTPVKRYSSGMYVRLAFAVAAHLEPEILIVDEVLAVGDGQFQKKCMGKMEQVGKEGRTVLFVSHNMGAIARLCQRAILLSAGEMVHHGDVSSILPLYQNQGDDGTCSAVVFPLIPDKPMQVTGISIHHTDGGLISRPLAADEPIAVQIRYRLDQPFPGGFAAMLIRNQAGEIVLFSDSRDCSDSASFEHPGLITVTIDLPAPLLVPGKYYVSATLARPPMGTVDGRDDAVSFEIQDNQGVRQSRAGYIYLPARWQLQSDATAYLQPCSARAGDGMGNNGA